MERTARPPDNSTDNEVARGEDAPAVIESDDRPLVVDVDDPIAQLPRDLQFIVRHGEKLLGDEFTGIFGRETIHRFLGEALLAFPKATVKSFLPLFMERFTRQRLRALARLEGLVDTDKPMVVFLCIHNAGRSQMAAGWLRHLGGDGVEVFSGGSDPAREPPLRSR